MAQKAVVVLIRKALHDAGLSVSLSPTGDLGLSPANMLTSEWRSLLRGNKATLVHWLQAANDPEPRARLDATAWRIHAEAYHQHHFGCTACIAAGRGVVYGLRCGLGAALWVDYQAQI